MSRGKIYNEQDIIFVPHPKVWNFTDYTGKKIGKLTILGYAGQVNKRGAWWCKCDCGNIVKVLTSNLRGSSKRPSTKSCGCLHSQIHQERAQDLIGKTFGYLKPVERVENNKYNQTVWKCLCINCGRYVEVPTYRLTSGNTKSCGCIKSYGEKKIIEWLIKNNIYFEKEKTFNDLVSKNNIKLRYDFFIPQKQLLIEFDGPQHETYTGYDWNTEENFKILKEHDNLKNNYAKENNFKLLRIPYKDKDNIEQILEKVLIENE